jgi:hypothetical protein
MSASKRVSAILSFFIVFISACKAGTPPPTPLTHLTAPQGGKIVFGTVDGATSQATAMSKILDNVKNNCGEKPQIGKVFQFKGTKTVGVFFTVTNHPGGNTKVAGLVLSAASGPRQVEAALLSDDAQRIGKSVNPMLQQLFDAWHPGGRAAVSSSAFNDNPASGGGSHPASGHNAPAARLHTVSTSDSAASIGIPDGWRLDSQSGGGAVRVFGPKGEMLLVNGHMNAVDPTNPRLPSFMRSQVQNPSTFVYPYHGNLMKNLPNMLQAWGRASGNPPSQVQVDTSKPVGAGPGQECVQSEGYMNLKGNKTHFNAKMCANTSQDGSYIVWLDLGLLPADLFDQENPTMAAIYSSVNLNQQVIGQQTQAGLDRIHQIGAQAAADRATRNATYDAQHAGYWAQQHNNDVQHNNWSASQSNNTVQSSNSGDGQDTTARNNQGFSNYLLDQTVVQGNDIDGSGAVGHATVWNSTADALVKADPNRFEYVPQPNFWQGTDYHR